MVGDTRSRPAAREPLVRTPGQGFVEEAEVARLLDIVAQRLQRPDDDVAMAAAGPDLRIGLEHEPLRPVAALLVSARRRRPSGCPRTVPSCSIDEEELDRPLADVARAPGGAGVLLEPVRNGQVDHRIMREPGQEGVLRVDIGARPRRSRISRDMAPIAAGGREHGLVLDAAGIALGERLALGGVRHRADDGEGETDVVSRQQREIGPAPRDAVGIEELVASDRLDLVGGIRDEVVGGVLDMFGPIASKGRASS